MEGGHGQDGNQVDQDPHGPRPDGPRHQARHLANPELGLHQVDKVRCDGQHRDDLGGAAVPEDQREVGHDPGVADGVPDRGPDAGAGLGGEHPRGRWRQPAEQPVRPGQENESGERPDRVLQQHDEHRPPGRLSPGEVPARGARAAQVQPGGQARDAGDLRQTGLAVLGDELVFFRVAGQRAFQEGGDHVLFPPLPVVGGQYPQRPPVPLLQPPAHPRAPPIRPSFARATRAVAARSSASSASAWRPSEVIR